jgi:N-acylneuraminate cytidylyltransferase
LGLECIVAHGEKMPILKQWLRQNGVSPEAAIYIGNDEPDVPCLLDVACGVAPADAYAKAKSAAKITLSTYGGHGCIRELTGLLFPD